MAQIALLLFFLAIFEPISYCALIRGRRTLVIFEHDNQKSLFSSILNQLDTRNFSLTYRLSDDPSLTLSIFGEYIYENLLLFSPSTEEFGGRINLQSIIDFVDSGRNLFIGIDSQVTILMREIALKCGMDIDEPDTSVIDHFHHYSNPFLSHQFLQLSNSKIINSTQISGPRSTKAQSHSILYNGVGIRLNHSNPLVFNILDAYSSSYSSIPSDSLKFYPHSIGHEVVLIAGLQTRNNGRVIISGSLDFFSDKCFVPRGRSPVHNKIISTNLLLWCFKFQGILRIFSVDHFRSNDYTTPITYTVNDDVSYYIRIEELEFDSWNEYTQEDVQLEFRRIDPFIRLTMNYSSQNLHNAKFRLPDVYGVFQFIVKYSRIGYNYMHSATQVSVRPFEHTEYERYISCAFPYYISSFSMLIGFLLFSLVFLNHSSYQKSKID